MPARIPVFDRVFVRITCVVRLEFSIGRCRQFRKEINFPWKMTFLALTSLRFSSRHPTARNGYPGFANINRTLSLRGARRSWLVLNAAAMAVASSTYPCTTFYIGNDFLKASKWWQRLSAMINDDRYVVIYVINLRQDNDDGYIVFFVMITSPKSVLGNHSLFPSYFKWVALACRQPVCFLFVHISCVSTYLLVQPTTCICFTFVLIILVPLLYSMHSVISMLSFIVCITLSSNSRTSVTAAAVLISASSFPLSLSYLTTYLWKWLPVSHHSQNPHLLSASLSGSSRNLYRLFSLSPSGPSSSSCL